MKCSINYSKLVMILFYIFAIFVKNVKRDYYLDENL